MKLLTTIALLVFSVVITNAQQFSISGKITDANKQPLEFCNIYVTGSTIGTTSDPKGFFKLENLKPGLYDLIISHISHEPAYRQIIITDNDIDLGSIELKETTFELMSVEVSQKQNKDWKNQFKQFKTLLLGDHSKNRYIEIPNEYNADFVVEDEVIKEAYPFQLQIINTYTGFEIDYTVKSLKITEKGSRLILGSARFTELAAQSSRQENRWKANRQTAYRGSIRHFFRSLLQDKLNDNGFLVQLTNQSPIMSERVNESDEVVINASQPEFKDLVRVIESDIPGVYRIQFDNYLNIKYRNEIQRNRVGQSSTLFAESGFIDVYENGQPVNPGTFFLYGYFATEGLYESLPSDFSFDESDLAIIAQKDPLLIASQKLSDYFSAFPIEKTFLHTDRTVYGNSEPIWYKAYLTQGHDHIPSEISNVLNVQLLSPTGDVIEQVKTYVEDGKGNGYIEIPESVENGAYQILAFTNWMKNFGEESFFRKTIQVYAQDSLSDSEKEQSTAIDLQFFPESGTFVEGIPTKVAFKAINQQGLPVAISGQILDKDNQFVTEFSTTHDGMGTLFLTPQIGKQYKAVSDEYDLELDLPNTANQGANIRINSLEDSLKVTIIKKELELLEDLNLVVHNKGLISSVLQIESDKQISIFYLPNSTLREGINALTLIAAENLPLAERLVFKSLEEPEHSLSIAQDEVKTRSKISFDIELELPDSIKGNLSISAIDLNQNLNVTEHSNITSELLLSSELNGYIHKPIQYFNPTDTLLRSKIDLVMLTNGWRTFDYQKALKTNNYLAEFLPKRGVTISGVASNRGNKSKTVANAEIVLINLDSEPAGVYNSQTNAEGVFEISEAKIFQTDSLIIKGQNEDKNDSQLSFTLDTAKYFIATKYIRNPSEVPQQLADAQAAFIRRTNERNMINEVYASLFDSTARQLDDVVVEAFGESKLQRRDETELLKTEFGMGDAAADFTDENVFGGTYGDIFMAIRGKIPGVDIVQVSNFETVVSIRQRGTLNPQEPMYLLDDVIVDKRAVQWLIPSMLDRVVVMKSAIKTATFGSEGFGGVMAFYSRKGVRKGSQKQDNLNLQQALQGLQSSRVFYSPKYDMELPQHVAPDRRATLYWQPDLSIVGKEKKTVSFWSSDLETEIHINIQGITETGQTIFLQETLIVENPENKE